MPPFWELIKPVTCSIPSEPDHGPGTKLSDDHSRSHQLKQPAREAASKTHRSTANASSFPARSGDASSGSRSISSLDGVRLAGLVFLDAQKPAQSFSCCGCIHQLVRPQLDPRSASWCRHPAKQRSAGAEAVNGQERSRASSPRESRVHGGRRPLIPLTSLPFLRFGLVMRVFFGTHGPCRTPPQREWPWILEFLPLADATGGQLLSPIRRSDRASRCDPVARFWPHHSSSRLSNRSTRPGPFPQATSRSTAVHHLRDRASAWCVVSRREQ